MPIIIQDTYFHEEEQGVHLHKTCGRDKELYCHIDFGIAKFTEYQRDLFQDFLSVIIDALENEEVDVFSFKKIFEQQLQDLNTKLAVFAEKIEDVDHFPLKGIVQVVYGGEYFASLIGDTGLIVMRNHKLNFMMSNEADDAAPIHLFSEVIEGEVREYDEIITIGLPITTYVDKSDLHQLLELSAGEEKNFVDALIELLQVRIDTHDIGFISSVTIESSAPITTKKLQKNISSSFKELGKLRGVLAPYQGYIIYGLIGLFGLVMIAWLVQSFLASNSARFVDESGGVMLNFTLEDIQKDIALFKNYKTSSDQKINKYNEIIEKLDILEANDRWINDVKELRKIVEKEYYEGFNIILAQNMSFLQDPVYTFSQKEKNTFIEPYEVFYDNNFYVGGKEGVLLGAVNDDIRGTLVSATADMRFKTCSFDLLKNGLYCVTEEDAIYHIDKTGLNPVTNAANTFPDNIAALGTFGSSNFYVMTDDPDLNSAGTYIVRYRNKLGSLSEFGDGTEYTLPVDENTAAFAASGFSSMAIDGQFLVRSPLQKALYQLGRPDGSTNFQYREIELSGGDNAESHSDDVKVIASFESRFVYLFDKEEQTFTVYRSTPYKTNDANTFTYSLAYFFKIKFSIGDINIIDAYVHEGERSQLYLLTENAIYNINLYDYIDTYFQKEANN